MTQCKQCGAELPDNAKYCLQCGAPVEPAEQTEPQTETAPQTETEQPSRRRAPLPELQFLQPAITGGMFLGLLSSMPIISAGNYLCCMWVLLGGAIAAVMLTKQRPITLITSGDGAFAGVLSGLFGAVVATPVEISLHLITARFLGQQQQQIQQQVEDLLNKMGAEPPMRDWVLRIVSGEVSTFTVLYTFFSNLIAFSLFAMIGGILAVAILNRRKATKST